MIDIRQLAGIFKSTQDTRYQRKPRVAVGRLGDGTTTKRVDVPGSTIHVFFRPILSDTELWQVRHTVSDVPRWHNWPVLCVFNIKIGEWEVAETDVDALPGYYDSFDFRYVTAHAAQHIYNENDIGHDPVWVYRRMIVDLRPRPAPDSSLRLYIQRGDLPYHGHLFWPGGYGPELTRHQVANNEVWVTHYIKRNAEIGIRVGSAHPAELRDAVEPLTAPIGTVPISYVALSDSLTTLTEAEIYDARKIACTVSGYDQVLENLQQFIYLVEEWQIKHAEGEL